MQVKKSEKASLEKDKLVYVLMGLVFVLSLVYVALEWTEREVTKYEVTDTEFLFEEEVEIQQTSQETPPPPPPPAVQEVEVLNVVEDNVETESIEVNTEETEQEVVIAAPVEAPVEEEEEGHLRRSREDAGVPRWTTSPLQIPQREREVPGYRTGERYPRSCDLPVRCEP